MRWVPALAAALLLTCAAATPATGRARTPRAVIALIPIGRVPAAAFEALVSPLREAFNVEVVIAPGLDLPDAAFDSRRGQHLSTALLDRLARARQPGWERLLGVADVDLYVPELNFVFGEGDPRRGVAVFSLARLRSRDEDLFRRRSETEAIHELGHAYGLGHCANPRCVMWFSNTLVESDRKGTSFCPAHAAQLAEQRGRAFK